MEVLSNKLEFIDSRYKNNLSYEEIKSFNRVYSYDRFVVGYIYKIKNKLYHKKKVYSEQLINELLGKIISVYLGDQNVESRIVIDELNNFYLLSQNFININHYYTSLNSGIFYKLKYDENYKLDLSNLDLVDSIMYDSVKYSICKKDLIKFKYKLKMMIISDYIRKQSDRWYRNFLIEYDKIHCKLMPLYDFEYSFLEFNKDLDNSFKFDLSNVNLEYIRNDIQFQELLNLVMDLDMKKVFQELFDKYPIRMNVDEIEQYIGIINEKKDEIKAYKLVR